MAKRLAKSYVLRITPKEGEPFVYATHLGSSLSIARDIAVERFNARAARGASPPESVALMLGGHVVDELDGRRQSHVQFGRALWG